MASSTPSKVSDYSFKVVGNIHTAYTDILKDINGLF